MGKQRLRPGRIIVPIGLVSAVLAAFLLARSATAQAPAGAFAAKTVTMIIGFGPGGGYDTWARLVAAHIGRHLPGNPTVVAQNLPGGGSYRAASFMYHQAPKDGSAMALIARDAVLGPLTGETGALFDATKFSWIGTPATETNICIAYHTAPVKTAHDLTEQPLIVGDNGPGTGTDSYPKALNAILGFKFKLVGGYPSSAEVFLAMERGEVQGICESLDNPQLPGVPFVLDLAKTPEDKQAIEFLYVGQGIGRPFIAPPDLPPPTLKILRDAFDATMKDPAFIAEATQRKYAIDPEDGATLEALVRKAYATPKPIIERIAKLIQ
jgi:tripartite-type tricarboxylate transporter receptor subunit TctC